MWANIAHEITHMGLHRFSGSYLEKISDGPAKAVVRRNGQTVVTGRLATRTPSRPAPKR